MEDTNKKWAVISGASSGIGAATARLFANQGWAVVLIARNADALNGIVSEISKQGGTAVAFPLDAADGPAVLAAAKRISTECGPTELLVHCAGAGEWKFIEETSPAQIRSMMDAPFFAAFHLTHALMPGMIQRRKGLVVHVNSPVSSMGWPGATGYLCSRWALRGLHEALGYDLAGTGVRSSHVVFGKVTSAYFLNNPGSEERIPQIAKWVPSITPDQCAKVIYGIALRPRREVFFPFMLRVFVWANRLAPALVRQLAIRTGARRSGTLISRDA